MYCLNPLAFEISKVEVFARKTLQKVSHDIVVAEDDEKEEEVGDTETGKDGYMWKLVRFEGNVACWDKLDNINSSSSSSEDEESDSDDEEEEDIHDRYASGDKKGQCKKNCSGCHQRYQSGEREGECRKNCTGCSKSISNKQPVLSSSSMSSSTFSSSSSSSSLMKKNKKMKKKIAPPLSTATHDLHNSLCQTCGGIGDLMCCDFCNFVYHMECLPVNEIIPEEPAKWACPACMQDKRHQATSFSQSSSSSSSSLSSSKKKIIAKYV